MGSRGLASTGNSFSQLPVGSPVSMAQTVGSGLYGAYKLPGYARTLARTEGGKAMGRKLQQAGAQAGKGLQQAGTNIKEGAKGAGQYMSDTASAVRTKGALATFKSGMSSAGSSMRTGFSNAGNSMGKGLMSAGTNINKGFASMGQNMKEGFMKKGGFGGIARGMAFSAGKAAVKGSVTAAIYSLMFLATMVKASSTLDQRARGDSTPRGHGNPFSALKNTAIGKDENGDAVTLGSAVSKGWKDFEKLDKKRQKAEQKEEKEKAWDEKVDAAADKIERNTAQRQERAEDAVKTLREQGILDDKGNITAAGMAGAGKKGSRQEGKAIKELQKQGILDAKGRVTAKGKEGALRVDLGGGDGTPDGGSKKKR